MTSLAQFPALLEQDTTAPAFAPARRDGGARLLLIDDERAIWRAVRQGFASTAFELAWASTALHGLELALHWRPDVVILELSLPDYTGFEACRQLRTWSASPVIVLSARDNEADKLMAFAEGADDYVTKPFSIAELEARIRVALRHTAQSTGSARGARFEANGLCLDFECRQVRVDGADVHLTPTEYELLKYLAQHLGKVITHRDLLRAVWGLEYEDATHYLRVCVGHLRHRISPACVRGVGAQRHTKGTHLGGWPSLESQHIPDDVTRHEDACRRDAGKRINTRVFAPSCVKASCSISSSRTSRPRMPTAKASMASSAMSAWICIGLAVLLLLVPSSWPARWNTTPNDHMTPCSSRLQRCLPSC
jgi:two-component system KDP operon response regulator KdpE